MQHLQTIDNKHMSPRSQEYNVTRWQSLTGSCWQIKDEKDFESLEEDFWTMNLQYSDFEYDFSDDFDSHDENIYV